MKKGCKCEGNKEEKMKHWVIVDYKCNYSAFSGYKKTYSDYSSIRCNRCNAYWRTKANYVYQVYQLKQQNL